MTITIEDLSAAELREFLQRVRLPQSDDVIAYNRRIELRNRWAIQTEDYDHLIAGRLGAVYNKHSIIREVSRWALGLFNPQKTAVRRVAVGYKRRPTRKMGSKARTKQLGEFYRRLRFNKRAAHWHQTAVALNRVLVVARPLEDMRGPVVGFDVLGGHRCEVLREDGKTDDHPPAIAGVLLPRKFGRRSMRVEQEGARVMVIDERWFTVFDSQNNVIPEETYEHGLGRFPGAWMSHVPPQEGDAWNGLTGRGMTQTTLEVGAIAASMGWTRKTQCRKLLTMIFDEPMGEEDGAPDGQVIGHPEGVLSLNGENMELLVSDLNTAVTDFLTHIDALERRAFEQFTGAPAMPHQGPAATNPEHAAAHMHAASAEVHAEQVDGLEHFERDLAHVAALMARRIGQDAPDPSAVRDEMSVQFPTLPYIDTPKDRIEVWREWIALGVGDAVGFKAEIDGTSEAEAEGEVLRLAERQARLNRLRATHNSPASADAPGDAPLVERPGERPEASTGRFGGQAQPPPNP